MKKFIFLTCEGTTFQPDSDFNESEMDNLQVLGFANSLNAENAFADFIKDNSFILETNFDEVISYQLSNDFNENQKYFYLSEYKIKQKNIKK